MGYYRGPFGNVQLEMSYEKKTTLSPSVNCFPALLPESGLSEELSILFSWTVCVCWPEIDMIEDCDGFRGFRGFRGFFSDSLAWRSSEEWRERWALSITPPQLSTVRACQCCKIKGTKSDCTELPTENWSEKTVISFSIYDLELSPLNDDRTL